MRWTAFSYRTLLVVAILAMALAPQLASAKTQAEIDASVAAALERFRTDVANADEYLEEAKGVLVVPDVKKVGFVVAAQWGTGALCSSVAAQSSTTR